MAMEAGLVAAIAEIGLQGIQPDAPQGREVGFDQQREGVAHFGVRAVVSAL